MFDIFRLNPSETSLKGRNRDRFEQRLLANLAVKMRPWPQAKLSRRQGGLLAEFAEPPTIDETEAILTEMTQVFGIGRVVPGRRSAPTLEAITRLAVEMAATLRGSFKVESRRADKRFPMTSLELSRAVGGAVAAAYPQLTVDVHDPQTIIELHVDGDAATVSVGSHLGPGGLPLGVSGKVVTLLSGGIDSPVAAWKLMRRGCESVFLHCHSYPYVNQASVDKVRRLAEALARWQPNAKLLLVPIGDAQREIVAKANESFRVLLYRRLMLRLAGRVAAEEGADAIVTGDSVGQVASQTLENLAAVTAAAPLVTHRPLIGDNKEDIVRLARQIGTYAIAIEPHEDCCSLFVPAHPETRARLVDVEREEAKYDVAALVEAAWAKRELVVFEGGKIKVEERGMLG